MKEAIVMKGSWLRAGVRVHVKDRTAVGSCEGWHKNSPVQLQWWRWFYWMMFRCVSTDKSFPWRVMTSIGRSSQRLRRCWWIDGVEEGLRGGIERGISGVN